MPTFAARAGIGWSGARPFRKRGALREAWFRLLRDPAEDCRRTLVTRRRVLAEAFDRFRVRVVAGRGAAPEPLSLTGLDLLGERSELVAVLALIRGGLLLRLERARASATLVSSVRVDGTFLGLSALRRSDVLPSFGEFDLARVDLPPESLAGAGAVLASLGVRAA